MGYELTYSDDGTLYLRKSMIESYDFCPRQFKKTYLEGNLTQSNYIMDLGTRFHEFAHWFFDIYEAIPVEMWTELVPGVFNSEEQDMAYWFLLTEQERYNQCTGRYVPIQREMKLIDHDMCLTGTVDRIDEGSDPDELIIVEYKTGRSFREDSITQQLSFYKLIWDNTIKKGNIKYMKYINPRTQTILWIEHEEKMTTKLLKKIDKLRQAIADDNFPCRCSPVKHIICNMCTFEECGLYRS